MIKTLKKILSPEVCAECRLCCFFDGYSAWDTPTFTQEEAELVIRLTPQAKPVNVGSCRRFRVDSTPPDIRGFYPCPALNPEEGCMLGNSKPFECTIWPYRIMDDNGAHVIGIARMCNAMSEKPLSELSAFLFEDGLADKIFEYAEKYPDIIKPITEDYTVLIRR